MSLLCNSTPLWLASRYNCAARENNFNIVDSKSQLPTDKYVLNSNKATAI